MHSNKLINPESHLSINEIISKQEKAKDTNMQFKDMVDVWRDLAHKTGSDAAYAMSVMSYPEGQVLSSSCIENTSLKSLLKRLHNDASYKTLDKAEKAELEKIVRDRYMEGTGQKKFPVVNPRS